MVKIDTGELIKRIIDNVKEKIHSDKYKSIPDPHLVIIQVGDNVNAYDKKKVCEYAGIKCSIYEYKEDITTEKLKDIISKLSLNPTITAISIQLPLPEHIDERALIDEIDPNKDVDGVTCVQAGLLQLGIEDNHRLEPCIPKAIVRLLEDITTLEGKNITIIGKKIGKPLIQLLQEKNANVTLCHSRTNIDDIERNTEKSNIIILASNKAKYFGARYFFRRFFYDPSEKIIIDVGFNIDENGKLYGDLNTEEINDIINNSNTFHYTEVGEINNLSNILLLENISIAYEAQFDNIWKYHQMKKMEKEDV